MSQQKAHVGTVGGSAPSGAPFPQQVRFIEPMYDLDQREPIIEHFPTFPNRPDEFHGEARQKLRVHGTLILHISEGLPHDTVNALGDTERVIPRDLPATQDLDAGVPMYVCIACSEPLWTNMRLTVDCLIGRRTHSPQYTSGTEAIIS
jgi:hypothetical protein